MKGQSEVDYRYVTKDESREFHKRRRAFVIFEDKVYLIDKNSEMSHWEFCQNMLNITKEQFVEITRGYYLNEDLVFYKDNFSYDDKVIREALNHVVEIKEKLNIDYAKINFGLKAGKPGEIWQIDCFYGELLSNNEVKKTI